ncbi:hypothetical protein RHS03_05755, partial [Rhizoctonia solani]
MEVLAMNKLDYLPIWDQIVTAHSAKSAGAREPEILEKLERDAPGNLAYASRAFRAHELMNFPERTYYYSRPARSRDRSALTLTTSSPSLAFISFLSDSPLISVVRKSGKSTIEHPSCLSAPVFPVGVANPPQPARITTVSLPSLYYHWCTYPIPPD